MRNLIWLYQKLLRKCLSAFSPQQKIIQLNQARPESPSDIRILGYSNEKFGLNQYKQVSEFRAVFEIHNAIVNPKSGVAWFQNKVVAESSIWHPIDLKKFEPKPLFPEYIDSDVVILPDNGYFHYLTEELPRYLEAIQHSPRALSIYSASSSDYVKDFLQILQGQSRGVRNPIRTQSLILSEKIRGGVMTATDLMHLREFQKRIRATTQKDRKIFVYRSDMAGTSRYGERGLTGQNQVMSQLEEQGFQTVSLENLTLQDQITLFAETSTIAGFHGAGLANQIWMRPGGRVIEFTGIRRTQHFKHLACLSGHEYSEVSVIEPPREGNIGKSHVVTKA